MAQKFKYNHESLDFYEARDSLLAIWRKGVIWLFAGLLFFGGYYVIFAQLFSTPKEKTIEKINKELESNYAKVNQQYKQLDLIVTELVERDKNIYRRIFETDPPIVDADASISLEQIDAENNTKLTHETKDGIDKLQATIKEQTKLLSDMIALEQRKDTLSNIPSIQPVSNKNLHHIAATYGMRMHPFYKLLKLHTGIDFSIPLGTNVFATANGVVESVKNSMRNTGLSVVIDHQNGYKTHYQHLYKATISPSQKVKRGDVIGFVGNTGRSVAPHLHYEIWKDNTLVNPIHYFFEDITPDEYQKLKIIAANKGQSLD
jgi:murein DD-endopeptidase MepM/ murein hydrolase activator NlpD